MSVILSIKLVTMSVTIDEQCEPERVPKSHLWPNKGYVPKAAYEQLVKTEALAEHFKEPVDEHVTEEAEVAPTEVDEEEEVEEAPTEVDEEEEVDEPPAEVTEEEPVTEEAPVEPVAEEEPEEALTEVEEPEEPEEALTEVEEPEEPEEALTEVDENEEPEEPEEALTEVDENEEPEEPEEALTEVDENEEPEKPIANAEEPSAEDEPVAEEEPEEALAEIDEEEEDYSDSESEGSFGDLESDYDSDDDLVRINPGYIHDPGVWDINEITRLVRHGRLAEARTLYKRTCMHAWTFECDDIIALFRVGLDENAEDLFVRTWKLATKFVSTDVVQLRSIEYYNYSEKLFNHTIDSVTSFEINDFIVLHEAGLYSWARTLFKTSVEYAKKFDVSGAIGYLTKNGYGDCASLLYEETVENAQFDVSDIGYLKHIGSDARAHDLFEETYRKATEFNVSDIIKLHEMVGFESETQKIFDFTTPQYVQNFNDTTVASIVALAQANLKPRARELYAMKEESQEKWSLAQIGALSGIGLKQEAKKLYMKTKKLANHSESRKIITQLKAWGLSKMADDFEKHARKLMGAHIARHKNTKYGIY